MGDKGELGVKRDDLNSPDRPSLCLSVSLSASLSVFRKARRSRWARLNFKGFCL